MASLSEIIYDELTTIKGSGRFSDDNMIPIEQLEYLNINNRSYLIRQDQNKGRSLSDNITQVLPCVEVVSVSTSECPCNVEIDCTILRTKNRIPRPIELFQKDLITRVSGADMTGKGWSIISFARASVAGSNNLTSQTPKAFLHDGYVYILFAPAGIKYISISLVAEDPREAASFANCSGGVCYTNDMPFPISNYMIPLLKEMVLKDLKIEITVPVDYKGDEKSKGEPQSS